MISQSLKIYKMDDDKPHRCPSCWAVAVDVERPKWWKVYQCCTCKAEFTRWPNLSYILPHVGVACSFHLKENELEKLDKVNNK